MTRAWLASLALLSMSSCTKEGTTTPPQVAAVPDEPSDPPPADATEGATDPAPADDGGDAPPATEAPPSTEAPATDPAAETPPDPAPETPEAPPETPPAKSALALPKPLNKSVKKSCGKDPGVGQRLKSFKLPTTEEGKTYSNGSFRGRVVLVNFWGTWCKPCLKELPKFAQLYRRYRKHGMTLLAIATDDDPVAVKDTLAKKKIAAKVAIAGEEYAGNYESPDFPFTFVVDHKGVIRASYFGYEPDCMGKLEADIREQLEKRAAAKK
ncbi:MAG: redoxin family protein [Myxococcota bacterium]